MSDPGNNQGNERMGWTLVLVGAPHNGQAVVIAPDGYTVSEKGLLVKAGVTPALPCGGVVGPICVVPLYPLKRPLAVVVVLLD